MIMEVQLDKGNVDEPQVFKPEIGFCCLESLLSLGPLTPGKCSPCGYGKESFGVNRIFDLSRGRDFYLLSAKIGPNSLIFPGELGNASPTGITRN